VPALNMKITSMVFGLIVGLVFFIFLPYVFVLLNNRLSLPVYSNDFLKLSGVLLIIVGIIIFVYCSGLFIILGRSTPVPVEPPKKLIVSGLYKYTRNPIYLGYFMIFLGEFLFFGQLLLLIYFFLTIVKINLYVIYYEEPILKKRFGKSYEEYLKKIPRWI
jgi:protein-S-isoprenylcysteine O-methyltransferase Ste14